MDEKSFNLDDEEILKFNLTLMNFHVDPVCPACEETVPDRCEYVWQAQHCPNRIKRDIRKFLDKEKKNNK